MTTGAACSAFLVASQVQAEEDPWSFGVSLDANSHFMSYGFNVWQPDTDDIGDEWLFQPSASVEYAISETSGVYAGAWFDVNSLADDPDVGPDLGGDVQEMDIWVGYWFSTGDFTFDFTLQQWYYASEVEGIFDITISHDSLFAPYLRAHTRFESVGGQEKGTIFETGVTLYEGEIADIAYGFSAGLAFNFDDYHQSGEDGYAYSFLGASASYVIYSSDSLEVDLHGGLTYYNTDEDNVGNIDDDILTANFGVGFSF